jgi:hypothetical protein
MTPPQSSSDSSSSATTAIPSALSLLEIPCAFSFPEMKAPVLSGMSGMWLSLADARQLCHASLTHGSNSCFTCMGLCMP